MSALIAATLGLLASTPVHAAPSATDEQQAKAMLAELVAIDTSEPHGSTAAAQALAARFRQAGFAAGDVQVLAPAEHPEKGNLVVRLRGRGGGRPLVWTSHLDVVAADPKDWSSPPFTLTEKDGWYYGRGVSDMKGEAVAVASALMRLKREGFVPAGDVLAVFTADEEAAGRVNGVRWLLQAHPELFSGAIVLNPDAGGAAARNRQVSYFGLQTAEKTYATFVLEAAGKGGHSSRPGPDNAIYDLAAALVKLQAYRFPVRLNATTRAFLTGSAVLESPEVAADMRAVAADPANDAAAARLARRVDLNAILRTTCVATMVAAGEVENALPQRARATVQCRLIPGERPEAVQDALVAVVADPRIAVRLDRPVNLAPETAPDPEVTSVIRSVVDAVWPGVPTVIRMDSGGSDAVFTRAAGLPTYGVSAVPVEIGDDRHHGIDERISAAGFRQGLEFTYRLTRQLGQAPGRRTSNSSKGAAGKAAVAADQSGRK